MKLDAIGELFARSWRRLQERWNTVAKIYLVPLVLMVISQLLFINKSAGAVILGGFLSIIAGIISVATVLALITAYSKGMDFAESYRNGFKLFWSAIWICILAFLGVAGGFVMLIIPGIMLAVQFAFYNYALVVDGRRGMSALATSREYLKGYWWAFAGRSILLGIIFGAAMLILYVPFTILVKPIAPLIYGALLLVFTPFSISYQYEIFENLRRLKPDVAQAAAQAERGFLKVAMVVGIVGIALAIILFFAAIAFFVTTVLKWSADHPGGVTSSSLQEFFQEFSASSTQLLTSSTRYVPVPPIHPVGPIHPAVPGY